MRPLLVLLLLLAGTARADPPGPTFGSPAHFTEAGGEAIYQSVCAGCHMPDGKGATGAATYPSLADDARLVAAGYPITLVLRGRGAMPPFGRTLTDAQVAAVVGFIRSHFGNAYADEPAEAEVAAAR